MFIRIHSKKVMAAVLCSSLVLSVAACGSGDNSDETPASIFEPITEDTNSVETPATEETPAEEPAADEPYVLPEGMYISELTGEPISEEIRNQRPIAAMVDNEIKALPHYGTSEADVVYELMNSTKNDRITRLMCIVKDWGNIEQLGSIRSTRPTNILLASEWNAVLCHDGGPYYNDQYFARDWSAHFSGTFSRVNNGKAKEFTEYIISGDLESNFNNYSSKAGYETTYNQFANEGSHFNFVDYGTEFNLDEKYDKTYSATIVTLPFTHNQSQLVTTARPRSMSTTSTATVTRTQRTASHSVSRMYFFRNVHLLSLMITVISSTTALIRVTTDGTLQMVRPRTLHGTRQPKQEEQSTTIQPAKNFRSIQVRLI